MSRCPSMLSVLAFGGFLVLTTPAFADDYKAAAEDVCKCQEKPHKKSAEAAAALKAAQATGDFSAVMRIQGEMMAMMGEIQACYDELPKKYPKFAQSESDRDKVNAIAEELCPNPAEEAFRQ